MSNYTVVIYVWWYWHYYWHNNELFFKCIMQLYYNKTCFIISFRLWIKRKTIPTMQLYALSYAGLPWAPFTVLYIWRLLWMWNWNPLQQLSLYLDREVYTCCLSCMVTKEVGIVLNQVENWSIMNIQQVDRSEQILNIESCKSMIKYITRTPSEFKM